MHDGGYPFTLRLHNGIDVSMRDFRVLHEQDRYAIHPEYSSKLWNTRLVKPRQLFYVEEKY